MFFFAFLVWFFFSFFRKKKHSNPKTALAFGFFGRFVEKKISSEKKTCGDGLGIFFFGIFLEGGEKGKNWLIFFFLLVEFLTFFNFAEKITKKKQSEMNDEQEKKYELTIAQKKVEKEKFSTTVNEFRKMLDELKFF